MPEFVGPRLREPDSFDVPLMTTPALQPVVSVVVPCFNAEKFIREAIESVLSQTRSDLELIIVDDGSTDGSAEVINAFVDPRVRYMRQDNAGVATARNTGIAAARGYYVSFLDADDIYLPSNLEKKIAFLETRPGVDLVYSSEIIFESETGSEIGQTAGRSGSLLKDFLELRPGLIHSPSSVMVRRAALERVHGFDARLSTSADWDMWIRLAAQSELGYIHEPLARYRSHPDQMHRNIRLMMNDTLYVLRKSHVAGLFVDEAHYRYCKAKLYLVLAMCFLRDSKDPLRFGEFLTRSVFTSTTPLRERLARR